MASARPARGKTAKRDAAKGKPTRRAEGWRTRWPASSSVRDWIVTIGEKARAIPDLGEYVRQMSFAIGRLAERGFTADAEALARQLGARLKKVGPAAAAEAPRFALVNAYLPTGRRERILDLYRAEFDALQRNANRLKPKPLAEAISRSSSASP